MPDFTQLTDRQREIYDFIKSKIDNRGYGPTVREIGDGFGIRTPNGVMCHLKALEQKGLILREGFSARAIQVVQSRHLVSPEELQEFLQLREENQDLQRKLKDIMQADGSPAPCPHCGSTDDPICPKCHEYRA